HRRAYIACQGNAKLLVFNLQTHAVENVLPTGLIPDVLAFDRELNLLYVAPELGPVFVYRFVESEGRLRLEGTQDVGANAHTVSVDSSTHRVYFPIKRIVGGPILHVMLPTDLRTKNAVTTMSGRQ